MNSFRVAKIARAIVDDKKDKRPRYATIIDLSGPLADIRVGLSRSILHGIEIQGDYQSVKVGDEVQIVWADNRRPIIQAPPSVDDLRNTITDLQQQVERLSVPKSKGPVVSGGGGGGATSLDGLSDVTITSPVSGQVLKHDGSGWVNGTAAGSGDMPKSEYDANGDGKVNSADTADAVPWSGVSGKPSTFTPATHTHTESDITNLDHNAVKIQGKSVDAPVAGDHLKQLTYDNNNNKIAWLSGAGQSIYSLWDVNAPSASPSNLDDEFTSDTIANYTEFDPNGLLTPSVSNGDLVLDQTTRTGDNVCALLKELPAGDFTITTRVDVGVSWTNWFLAGLALFENPADSTKKILTLDQVVSTTSTVSGIQVRYYTNHNTLNGSTYLAYKSGFLVPQLYLRLRRNSTTYYASWSPNGIAWTRLWTNTIAFTPTYFGLECSNANTGATQTVHFPFIRYSNRDLGRSAPLSGQMVPQGGSSPGLSCTVSLAKLTPGGANGSLTYTNGILTAKVDPT